MTLSIALVMLLTGLTGTIPGAQVTATSTDVSSTLARADAAYYDARFDDVISLLAPLDAALEGKSDRIDDRVRIKLQLAMAHIGLNQIDEAKMQFAEIYEINPQFVMDPAKFAPKVLTLFNEAKAARAADDIFKEAVEEYRRGDLRQSLSKIRTVLKLNPNDALATQYLNLIHERLEVSIKLAALQWRNQFDAHDYSQASESYRQIVATNLEDKAAVSLEQIRGEYRKTLTGIFQSWSQACKTNDRAAVNRLRTEASGLLPDASIGKDVLDQMTNCAATPTAPTTAPPTAPPAQMQVVSNPSEPVLAHDCIQNPASIALTRLKKRIEPQFPPEARRKRVRVRAMVRIDDSGNTTVHGLTGGTPDINRAVVKAVQNWKFYPAQVDKQPRCVETELSIVLAP